MPMRFDVITLFPEMFAGVLGGSILERSARRVPDPAAPDDPTRARPPVASYHLHQLRDFSADRKHAKVDRPPYGGGAGMVLQCQPLWDAVKHVETIEPSVKPHRIFVTPTGRPFTQRVAEELAGKPRLLLICGHYEGFDQRVLDALHEDASGGGLDEISVGDVVLSGGELPAMTLIDAVVRLLPGALGDADSHVHDSFSPGVDRLLDHPHYTHPPAWLGREVPAVLRSGDHGKIAAWRADQSRKLTETRRPDLLMGAAGHTPQPLAVIREATDADLPAILNVHRAAFGRDHEARMVETLHGGHDQVAAYVAEVAGRIVGHASLLVAHLADQPGLRGLLVVGRVGVEPAYQERGLGSALVEVLIRDARDAAAARLFVLGSAAWYSRFGFEPAESHGFTCAWGDGPAFMVLPLKPGRDVDPGEVRWPEAFDAESSL
ncbi:MAG: tRNA (guanosine(37)-N1)-methyltransferase TrmD [Planctomycetota bacterium]